VCEKINKRKVFFVIPLDDGTYEVIVVDAQERDETAIAIDVAITSGARRGEMVTVLATNIARTATDLLAMPATLIITNGQPHLAFDQ
jgi:hypothetical protein